MALDEAQLVESEYEISARPQSGNRARKILANFIELPIFLTMVSLMLAGTAVGNILLYRTCVHSLEYDIDDCRIYLVPDKGSTNSTIEQAVQKYAAFVGTVRSVIEALAPAALSLFFGVWSNTYGRKSLIVWPLLGLTISSMMMVVYAMWEDLGPWWFIVTSLPMSVSGGITTIFTGSYCYVNDITTTEAKSLRLALFGASTSAGSVVGLSISAHLLKAVGNVYLLLIMSAVLVAAYVYAIVVLDESLKGAREGSVLTIFDISHIKDMANECFKKRQNHGRAQILLLAMSNSLLMFIIYGLVGVDYGYTREKIHWSLKDYNTFAALNTVISFVGSIVLLGVSQKMLNLSDLFLAITALVFAIGEYIIKAFAVSSWQFYLAAIVAIPKGLSMFLIRSLLTKILPADVVTKVFTLMSSLDALGPLIAPVIFNSLYAFSISTFPGGVYILSAGITVTCAFMLGFVQFYRWNVSTTYESIVNEESASED